MDACWTCTFESDMSSGGAKFFPSTVKIHSCVAFARSFMHIRLRTCTIRFQARTRACVSNAARFLFCGAVSRFRVFKENAGAKRDPYKKLSSDEVRRSCFAPQLRHIYPTATPPLPYSCLTVTSQLLHSYFTVTSWRTLDGKQICVKMIIKYEDFLLFLSFYHRFRLRLGFLCEVIVK